MSGRATDDMARDVRALSENHSGRARDRLIEAADRLSELDAEVKALTDGIEDDLERQMDHEGELRESIRIIRDSLPPCPTCGGTKRVWVRVRIGMRERGMGTSCPDCPDGKVPIERLVKVFEAVHADTHLDQGQSDGWQYALDYLRGIR